MAKDKLYREFSKEETFQKLEPETLEFWENRDIFRKSLEKGKNAPKFVFYEGPPTANGLPGVHHVLSRTLKDAICRYQTMLGKLVERKAGWDTHGLPVEIDVEKSHNISAKCEIEEFGIGKFNDACKVSVFKYVDEWEEMTRRIGYWLDMSKPYITCDPDYMESVWWLLAKFFRDGLMYRGHKVLPYCPRCGTGLSDHEVAQGYRDVEDPSLTVSIKLRDKDDEFFLVWTTTPWTLLSNVALAFHPEVQYVKVRHDGRYLWLAKARLEAVFGENLPEIVESKTGRELAGIDYEPLFRFVEPDKRAWFTILADYVTTEDGTGIVHIAPAFGKEDYDEGQRNNLPMVQLVEADGTIAEAAEPYAGMFFKDADPLILDDLEKRRVLFSRGQIKHSYPFCWRCDSPLIQYARGSWYIRTTAFKDKLLEANENIEWFPPEMKDGRFGDWLRNNIDWAISRERYWATPLPIWICDDCEHEHAIASRAELAEMAVEGYCEGMDLHKPHIDEVILKCPQCDGKMHRVPEVIDCWFDSGAMPFAQVHYPFENAENFEPKCFPAEFICEGTDQTRGWFYTLLAISTFVTGKSAYKRCLVNGLVLDKDGQKMSKSKGNAVNPIEVIEKHGADPLRWYLMANSSPWLPKRFDVEGVAEVSRIFFDTLRNTYGFFALYANIDGWTPKLGKGERTPADEWLLSRLNGLIRDVGASLDEYNPTRGARRITTFVIDELSNWYIRLGRKRFWGAEMTEDKKAAFSTLYEALITVTKLLAPFVPITAETIWRGLSSGDETMPESVHLADFPSVDDSAISPKLESDMAMVERIVTMGRNARQKANIKVRQPLQRLLVSADNDFDAPKWAEMLILRELNIKSLEMGDKADLYDLSAKANFKSLGPRFGPRMKELSAIIAELPSDVLKAGVGRGELKLSFEGEDIILSPEDDLILSEHDAEGFSVSAEDDIAVALDITLDEELIAEGFARELVNRIQNTRKEAGFDVTDRIEAGIVAPTEICDALRRHHDWIAGEVLAKSLLCKKLDSFDFQKGWDIDGTAVAISVRKI
ncbi:MAG TPA: isoleucine--tRNA ligase [candidate division Zixibacteria bacterium]|nr:isoleucine--tRNA ligase [candidate division Zixibacteria bacterium]